MESSPSVPPYVAGPVELAPFRALSLSPARVGDPSSARVFARPYRAVPDRLRTWGRRGRLHRDELPAVYLHEYCSSGLTVRGLVGCLGVSHLTTAASGQQIFPHEGVHAAQVEELARRMSEMRTNPAPIILVHHGPASVRELSREIRAMPPDQGFVDHAGQEHRIWAITRAEHLALLDEALAPSRLLIADGHHRFAAYVTMHRSDPTPTTARGLAMLVDQDETPLFLGAIHRVLHGVRLADLVDAARAAGAQVEPIPGRDAALAGLGPDTLVLTDGTTWATAALALPEALTAVQGLHAALLPALARRPNRIGYAHSVAEALESASASASTVLLPAVTFDQVLGAVRAGYLLPEKATSFQPKPDLGAFIRQLDE